MPSAASGETLSQRAHRILGVDLDTWLSDELTDNSTGGNRGDQIAHAQRKHRQRTQSYIQALEQEVLRLRGVELSLKTEIQTLQPVIETHSEKEQDLKNNGFNATSDSNQDIHESSAEDISVHWDSLSQAQEEYSCCRKAAETTPPQQEWSTAVPTWQAGSDDAMQVSEVTQTSPGANFMLPQANGFHTVAGAEPNIERGFLSSQMGVELILLLERPCLGHLKYTITHDPLREGDMPISYNFGTNHAFNLSTALYHDHRPDSCPDESHISDLELDKLLEASERLHLAFELTPVQVWALVCNMHRAKPIAASLVTTLFVELSKYSYCNSFGTALHKPIVQAALYQYFGSIPPYEGGLVQ